MKFKDLLEGLKREQSDQYVKIIFNNRFNTKKFNDGMQESLEYLDLTSYLENEVIGITSDYDKLSNDSYIEITIKE